MSTHQKKVNRLDWDSNFFGLNIGLIDLDIKKGYDCQIELESFDLVYVKSRVPIENLERNCFKEIRFTYTKEVVNTTVCSGCQEYVELDNNYEDIIRLGYLSGQQSRFLQDPNFSKKKFQRLYKKWIDNCIKSPINKVLVHSLNPIKGFMTLEFSDKYSAKIGLIAVEERHQGLGVAQALICTAENHLYQQGIKKFSVTTQGTNGAARRLYQKYGFSIDTKEIIYHKWRE